MSARGAAAASVPLCGAKITQGGFPMSVFGSCDMSIKFVDNTGLTVTIPREGHRVKNHGSVEGRNKLGRGGSIDDLAPDASKSVRQTLSIKCVDDAEFDGQRRKRVIVKVMGDGTGASRHV